MKRMQRLISLGVVLAMLFSLNAVSASAEAAGTSTDEVAIVLSDEGVTVDGEAAGTDESAAVYVSNDIIYYEDRDTYDSGNTYGEGTDEDKHTAEEAEAHTVVTITEAGTYRISGTLSLGQIAVDLGDDAKTDPTAVVTLILDGVDLTCTVAPALIFYSVYECDTDYVAYDDGETDSYTASNVQDTSAAGANIILADGSTNNIQGSYVAKIYKDDGSEKKLYKFDGAVYSKMSLNINSEDGDTGVLNVTAENEGIECAMHLTINGGIVNIQSQDDGVNSNEDNVSVTTINGGTLHIVAGLGSEGDGIDSNGYLTINGGTVIAIANPTSDSGLDSDMGSYINGGTVLATGSTMDWADSDSGQVTINLQFAEAQDADEAIIVTELDGTVIFAYDPDQDETTGSYNRSYQGAILSCAALTVGESYYIYVGGDVTGTETNGLYDASTVTGFTGAVRQVYTGTDVTGGMADGGMGDMTGDFDGTEGGAPSDEGTTAPEEGSDPSDEGTTAPGESFDPDTGVMPIEGEDSSTGTDADTMPSEIPDGTDADSSTSSEASNVFYMTDMVNSFSGVQDETEASGTDTDTDTDADSEGDTGSSSSVEDCAKDDSCPIAAYSDLSLSIEWYHDGIHYCLAYGLMNGTSITEYIFEPNTTLSRAMLVTILYRLDGSPEVSADADFTDVESGTWYSDAVAWAASIGLVDGYGDGTFGPSDDVTREQAAKILYQYATYKGYDVSASADLSDFPDSDAVSSWAVAYMQWAVGSGMIQGVADGDTTLLSPTGSTTRAQAATLIYRMVTLLSTDNSTESNTDTDTVPEVPDSETPDGDSPDGEGEGGMGSESGGSTGSSEVTQGSAATEITEDGTYTGTTYTSTGDDENALRITGATVTLDGITVSKSAGSSSDTEAGDFYGMNAALLATDGATVTITNATITSSAQNGNGVFSYGSGTTVTISDSVITTTADNSGGIQTTGGGTTIASNLTVTTSGSSSAAIRSDRGGGTVTVTGGTYTTNGYNSPAVYSTASISVSDAVLTANNSEALVIEGQNSITLVDCDVSGNMSDTQGTSSDINVHSVMIYQSQSGDAEVGTSAFSMTGGSLTSNNGDVIFVTNTSCTIYLSDVEIINNEADGNLLTISGNDASHGWGSAGSNGAQVVMTADAQTLEGDITVDTISTLDLTLTNGSTLTGTINIVDNAEGGTAVNNNAVITIESGCTWTLTGDCTITSLTNNGTINYNGYTITLADGTVLSE